MKSDTLAQLLATLSVDQSFSRPHVSDDNPFSEAQFKTLKYQPDYPGLFSGVLHARGGPDEGTRIGEVRTGPRDLAEYNRLPGVRFSPRKMSAPHQETPPWPSDANSPPPTPNDPTPETKSSSDSGDTSPSSA